MPGPLSDTPATDKPLFPSLSDTPPDTELSRLQSRFTDLQSQPMLSNPLGSMGLGASTSPPGFQLLDMMNKMKVDAAQAQIDATHRLEQNWQTDPDASIASMMTWGLAHSTSPNPMVKSSADAMLGNLNTIMTRGSFIDPRTNQERPVDGHLQQIWQNNIATKMKPSGVDANGNPTGWAIPPDVMESTAKQAGLTAQSEAQARLPSEIKLGQSNAAAQGAEVRKSQTHQAGLETEMVPGIDMTSGEYVQVPITKAAYAAAADQNARSGTLPKVGNVQISGLPSPENVKTSQEQFNKEAPQDQDAISKIVQARTVLKAVKTLASTQQTGPAYDAIAQINGGLKELGIPLSYNSEKFDPAIANTINKSISNFLVDSMAQQEGVRAQRAMFGAIKEGKIQSSDQPTSIAATSDLLDMGLAAQLQYHQKHLGVITHARQQMTPYDPSKFSNDFWNGDEMKTYTNDVVKKMTSEVMGGKPLPYTAGQSKDDLVPGLPYTLDNKTYLWDGSKMVPVR